ncbi:MAG: CAP domain-containing protein [Ilumatobacter sp.]|nr:CAP domain-containing protein [Ilumatobacter sp.]
MVAAVAVTAGIALGPAATPASAISAGDDWRSIVNTYRAMSGLDPVTENTTWSSQGQAHSCYMLQNGISHDEQPGNPGYTEGGDIAGNSGNVAVSSSVTADARKHIDLWMTGPFHAIGILRHSLRVSGFGLCQQSSTPTPWHSGGTLDVIRGIDSSVPRPSTPTLFPGDGATVPLHSFITEFPNPMTMCGWSGSAGLPLIAMMPSTVTTASTSITGPSGPMQTCTLHKNNVGDPTASSILGGDNAVIVMPRQPLADGTYTATVNSDGGNVTWSFTVDRDAPLTAEEPAPEPVPDTAPAAGETKFEPVSPFRLVDSRTNKGTTRLRANRTTRIAVGGSDRAAVSANFVAIHPDGYGYITAYNCTAELPEVSTLNYGPGQVVANQAVVPLDDGDLCVYSKVGVDLVIDVNGYFRTAADNSFHPVSPSRLLDSRNTTRLAPGQERKLRVAGSGAAAPGSASSVALNVTVVLPDAHGHLQVYPCGVSSSSEISTLNYTPDDVARPNSVLVPVGTNGDICLRSLKGADVIVDYTGYFAPGTGLDFVPLDPIRMFDSRSTNSGLNESTGGDRVNAGRTVRIPIAGVRGVPADATAVSVNLTATNATKGSFLTAFPCGPRPNTSNVNIVPWEAASANGATVKLSSDGDLCVYVLDEVHVIVDINGVYL